MFLSQFDFDLPKELIAQYPLDRRDQSRLMIVNRSTSEISEITFRDLLSFLNPQDALIFNQSKVYPARLIGCKETGAIMELLLIQNLQGNQWEVLAKPGKKCRLGDLITFSPTLKARVVQDLESKKIVEFESEKSLMDEVFEIGQIPLPPYIKREQPDPQDRSCYQTVYAKDTGSIAAPTAGLHFTEEMLAKLKAKGVHQEMLTLHVGIGTFKPIVSENLSEHTMHHESFFITKKTQEVLNQKKWKRSICVGTTTLRALESAANAEGQITQREASTDLFIQPGYRFKYVKHLLTNFHLPKSSLFILVSAFMGKELALKAYNEAVKRKFRFFSYGDAMLIL